MKFQIRMRLNAAEKVRRMIDDAMEQGPYIASHLATELVTKLREEDPALLAEWLDVHAEQIMRDAVSSISRSRRAYVRANASRSVFRNAVERHEAGEPELLHGWLEQEYPIGPENIRKRLGQMYREEVLYASQMHAHMARGNQMQSAFLRAVGEKVGARQVQDVFDNDQLNTLWKSIN